jgi:hypothetical protein
MSLEVRTEEGGAKRFSTFLVQIMVLLFLKDSLYRERDLPCTMYMPRPDD